MTTRGGGGVAQEDNRYSLWDDVHRMITQKKRKKQTNKLVHSTLGFKKNKIKIQKIQNQKKLITKNNNTEEDEETIQESSNQFTPFRRAVCDWLFKKKVESKGFSYRLGQGRAIRPRATQYPRGPLGKVSSS